MQRLPGIVLIAAFLAAPASHAADDEPVRADPPREAGVTETAPAGDDEPMPGVSSATLAEYERQPASRTMDELVLERTEITGNRELPKVLYIVPWHKSDPGALMGKPVNTLLDEVLTPLDREEFIRQVDYYSDLYNDDGMQPPSVSPAEAGIQSRKE